MPGPSFGSAAPEAQRLHGPGPPCVCGLAIPPSAPRFASARTHGSACWPPPPRRRAPAGCGSAWPSGTPSGATAGTPWAPPPRWGAAPETHPACGLCVGVGGGARGLRGRCQHVTQCLQAVADCLWSHGCDLLGADPPKGRDSRSPQLSHTCRVRAATPTHLNAADVELGRPQAGPHAEGFQVGRARGGRAPAVAARAKEPPGRCMPTLSSWTSWASSSGASTTGGGLGGLSVCVWVCGGVAWV